MKPIHITGKNFDEEVLKSKEPVLVDFWAPWCGPCRMLAPELEKLAEEGKVKVGKVNVDEERELASRFNIMSIPTLIIFREGRVLERTVGAMPYEMLRGWVEEVLKR